METLQVLFRSKILGSFVFYSFLVKGDCKLSLFGPIPEFKASANVLFTFLLSRSLKILSARNVL